jgi:hypothetical protein
MKKPDKILICGPYITSYDDVMLNGLSSGFNQLGIQTLVLSELPSQEKLIEICSTYSINIVMEINRRRNELPDLPKKILHISWLQDPLSVVININMSHNGSKNIGEEVNCESSRSDLTYYLTKPEILGYTLEDKNEYTGLLYTGVSLGICLKSPVPPISDFSIIGYIPPPLTDEILIKPMISGRDRPTICDVAQIFNNEYLSITKPLTIDDYHCSYVNKLVRKILREKFNVQDTEPFRYNKTMFYFEQHLARSIDRMRLTDKLLSISRSMRIYGGPEWLCWRKYKSYYQTFLSESTDICDVFRTTRLNFHNNINGFGLHSRVFDCMGSGGAIMINETSCDNLPGGIQTEFEPLVDYIPFNYYNLHEIAAKWLRDEKSRLRIGANAQKKVISKHTWKHRAEQIIKDLIRI